MPHEYAVLITLCLYLVGALATSTRSTDRASRTAMTTVLHPRIKIALEAPEVSPRHLAELGL